MEYILLIILAIWIGIAVATAVWWYRFTLSLYNDIYKWIQNEGVIFVETYLTRTFLNKFLEKLKFIKWKKEKLPILVKQTRMGDKTALTERIVKSKHTKEDNEK